MASRLPKANPLPPLPKLEGPRWFQARAIARGIKFLIETGMPINTAYTKTNMRRTAQNITGRTYPAGTKGLQLAFDDLNEMTSS